MIERRIFSNDKIAKTVGFKKAVRFYNHGFLSRYLKSVFPTVEEYLLLDVLSNSDNNVQKAADRLVKMGYVKRDTPSKRSP